MLKILLILLISGFVYAGDFNDIEQSTMNIKNTGTEVDSPPIKLKGRSGGGEIEGEVRVGHDANDPYIDFSVDDDTTTPSLISVIHLHDTQMLYMQDNSCDIGGVGANRPKDVRIAGTYYAGGVEIGGAGAWSCPMDGLQWNAYGHGNSAYDDTYSKQYVISGVASTMTVNGITYPADSTKSLSQTTEMIDTSYTNGATITATAVIFTTGVADGNMIFELIISSGLSWTGEADAMVFETYSATVAFVNAYQTYKATFSFTSDAMDLIENYRGWFGFIRDDTAYGDTCSQDAFFGGVLLE